MGSKGTQRWLWYILEKQTRKVVAFTFGPRTDATFKKLLDLFDQSKIDRLDTDDWGLIIGFGLDLYIELGKPLLGGLNEKTWI